MCEHTFSSVSPSELSCSHPISGSPLQTLYLPSHYSCLSREYTWLFSSANVPFSKEEALIAGFHIFQEKMFRLGGITILGKCGLLKKKKIPFSSLAGNSERKPWGVTETICVWLCFFFPPKQVFHPRGLMHGQRSVQLHMLVRCLWLDKPMT